MTAPTRERTDDEAFLRGCAVILLVVAATLTVAFALTALCGCALPAEALLTVPAALALAAGCELRSRLARAER